MNEVFDLRGTLSTRLEAEKSKIYPSLSDWSRLEFITCNIPMDYVAGSCEFSAILAQQDNEMYRTQTCNLTLIHCSLVVRS